MARLLCLVMLLSVLAAGNAAAQPENQYVVEMDLWIDGEQRGTPIVVAPSGELSSVEVGTASGEGGWKIDVLVEAPADGEGAPIGATWLNLTVHEQRDGEWEVLADSLLGIHEGRTGTMSLVEPGVEQATPENSQVYLTVQASRLRPGMAGSRPPGN
ncbi:MAG: hypothetical protein GVY11_06390 [Gammaproteobacteria bacterium]|nr:hypothetical protein [Gammaproteobacteria bacterium]